MSRFLTLALLLTVACSAPFRPETPHPTPAQMQELLAAPVQVKRKGQEGKTAFEIQVARFTQAGNDLYVTCHVPERFGIGQIRFGIEDVRVHEGPLDHTQNRLLVNNLPCGTLLAMCMIRTNQGLVMHARSVTIEVVGSGCGAKTPSP